jgi:hypothetical protein
MTPCIPENFSTWLVDWSLVTGNTMPPRDPNDDDDDDDEDDEAEPDDEPAVIRDPDSPSPTASRCQALRDIPDRSRIALPFPCRENASPECRSA